MSIGGLVNYSGSRNPWDFMDNLLDDVLFGIGNGGGKRPLLRQAAPPPMKLKETEEEYLISIAAPGLTRETFNIRVDGGVLSVSSNTEKEEDHQSYRSFGYESVNRSWTLPAGVDVESISATYRDGVLTIVVEKPKDDNEAGHVIEVS